MIGGIRLTRRVRALSHCDIWEAWHPELGQPVWIELGREYVDPLAYEAAAERLASLCTAHMAPVLGVGDDDGRPYLITEPSFGITLDERLDREPLSLREVTSLVQQLAGSIAQVHALGLGHGAIDASSIHYVDEETIELRAFDLTGAWEPALDLLHIARLAHRALGRMRSPALARWFRVALAGDFDDATHFADAWLEAVFERDQHLTVEQVADEATFESPLDVDEPPIDEPTVEMPLPATSLTEHITSLAAEERQRMSLVPVSDAPLSIARRATPAPPLRHPSKAARWAVLASALVVTAAGALGVARVGAEPPLVATSSLAEAAQETATRAVLSRAPSD
jgi:serine/threonine protein kinase